MKRNESQHHRQERASGTGRPHLLASSQRDDSLVQQEQVDVLALDLGQLVERHALALEDLAELLEELLPTELGVVRRLLADQVLLERRRRQVADRAVVLHAADHRRGSREGVWGHVRGGVLTERLLPGLLLLLHLRRHLVVRRDGRDVRVAADDVRVLAAVAAVVASRRHRSVVEVDAPDPTLVCELLDLPSPLALGNLCFLKCLGPDRPLLHARLEVAELHRELRRHLEQLGVGHRAKRVVGRRVGVLGGCERVHRLRLLLLLLLRRHHLLLLE